SQRFVTCRLGNSALAPFATASSSRCVVRRCPLGVASGNGAIGRMGYRTKEHAVMLVLSVIDLVLFEVVRPGRVGSETARAADWRPPLLSSVRLISPSLSFGDAKQTLGRDAAFCARALHLVAARKNPLARCASARPVCANFSACQRVDDLGTKISCARRGCGLGAELPGTSYHRGSGHLVLSW